MLLAEKSVIRMVSNHLSSESDCVTIWSTFRGTQRAHFYINSHTILSTRPNLLECLSHTNSHIYTALHLRSLCPTLQFFPVRSNYGSALFPAAGNRRQDQWNALRGASHALWSLDGALDT